MIRFKCCSQICFIIDIFTTPVLRSNKNLLYSQKFVYANTCTCIVIEVCIYQSIHNHRSLSIPLHILALVYCSVNRQLSRLEFILFMKLNIQWTYLGPRFNTQYITLRARNYHGNTMPTVLVALIVT